MPGNGLINYDFGIVRCMRTYANNVVANAFVCKNVQKATPLAAATVSIANNVPGLIIEPAGTIATLTVAFPTAPRDGQMLFISATATVTSLTITGATFGASQGPTALTAGDSFRYIYVATGNKWYKA